MKIWPGSKPATDADKLFVEDQPTVGVEPYSAQLQKSGLRPFICIVLAVSFSILCLVVQNFAASRDRLLDSWQRNISRVVDDLPFLELAIEEASVGQPEAFAHLTRIRRITMNALGQLFADYENQVGSPMAAALAEDIDLVRRQWLPVNHNIEAILALEPVAQDRTENLERLEDLLQQILKLTYQLQGSENFRNRAPRWQRAVLYIAASGERTRGHLLQTKAHDHHQVDLTARLRDDRTRLGQAVDEAMNAGLGSAGTGRPGANERAWIQQISSHYTQASILLEQVTTQLAQWSRVHSAQHTITVAAEDLDASLKALKDRIDQYAMQRYVSAEVGNVLGAVAILLLLSSAVALYKKLKLRMQAQAGGIHRANQRAILNLLDEISGLAEGDLSAHATANDDMIGTIADAINYTVDTLRELVTNINRASEEVATASQATRYTAMQLTEASEKQASQISAAARSIGLMAGSVDKVSTSAADSARVAAKSVTIAVKGARAVHDTVAGMETIRGTIQDTSKRIKRLGESSQEIGEIIGLINDIADQTHILALNAAIQASTAGDAGRGFAVVADEVQRLAERASQSTRQIEALVKAIQSDTNGAVNSMEQTTAGVVSGTRLARRAGDALKEIEGVSKQLATLIQEIAGSTRGEAKRATDVARAMGQIQEVTLHTRDGTRSTARSVGEISERVSVLKSSVAGFRLPEDKSAKVVRIRHPAGSASTPPPAPRPQKAG